MIDLGNLLSGAGVALGASMAGAGALKMFLAASHSIARVPNALERSAVAAERQANVIATYADLAKTLYDLRDGQEQIRITMSTVASRIDDLPCSAPGAPKRDCEGQ